MFITGIDRIACKIYSERNNGPEAGLIYIERKATCDIALRILCTLMERANTSSEPVEFMRHNDIRPVVQQSFSVIRISQLDAHILVFLRVSPFLGLLLCYFTIWFVARITSAIQRALVVVKIGSEVKKKIKKPVMIFDYALDQLPPIFHEQEEDRIMTQFLMWQRLDHRGSRMDHPIDYD